MLLPVYVVDSIVLMLLVVLWSELRVPWNSDLYNYVARNLFSLRVLKFNVLRLNLRHQIRKLQIAQKILFTSISLVQSCTGAFICFVSLKFMTV